MELDLLVQETQKPSAGAGLEYDSILGVTGCSPQYGLLGVASGRKSLST